jgi:elongation factor Ts
MQITAAMVKELRERTGAGMMECKKALTESDGDIDVAIENMRKAGTAKAAKKAGRIAAEGAVLTATSDNDEFAAMVEINCETDFVTKSEDFTAFADAVVQCVLEEKPADLDALNALTLGDSGDTVQVTRDNLVAKIGENINIRRFEITETEGSIGAYLHGTRIGVLVNLKGGDATLARDIAMHIAASRPVCVSEDEVSADILDKEKEIFSAQAAESGKPAEIIEKMVSGRIKKFIGEITLNGQPFIKNPDQTVGQLLSDAGASVTSFTRFEVGEGIEKKQEDFAAEVEAQAAMARKS